MKKDKCPIITYKICMNLIGDMELWYCYGNEGWYAQTCDENACWFIGTNLDKGPEFWGREMFDTFNEHLGVLKECL